MKLLQKSLLLTSMGSIFFAGSLSAQIFHPNGDILSVTPEGGPGLVVVGTNWTCTPDDGSVLPVVLSGKTQQLVTPDLTKVGNRRALTSITLTGAELPESLFDGLDTELNFHNFIVDNQQRYEGDLFVAQAWGTGKILELQLHFPAATNEGEFFLHYNTKLLARGACSFERDAFDREGSFNP